MAGKSESRPISIPQMLAVVGLVVIGYFVYSLGWMVWDGLSLKRIAEEYERDIASVKAEIADLEWQQARVASDAYVEEYARNIRKWVRAGETAVVVLDAPDSDWRTRPEPRTRRTEPRKEYWQEWWALFWDSPPP